MSNEISTENIDKVPMDTPARLLQLIASILLGGGGDAVASAVNVTQSVPVVVSGVGGTVRTLEAAGTPAYSTTLEGSHVLKASAGRLITVKASNLGVVDGFLQIFNKASAPAPGDVPIFTIPIYGGGFATMSNMTFATGIAVGLSSTADTFTAIASGWFYGETV